MTKKLAEWNNNLTLKELIDKIESYGNSELLFWSNAIAGEAGEFCNLVKKWVRNSPKDKKIRHMLRGKMKEELADIFIYIAITARDILLFDLEYEVMNKLKKVENERELEEDFE